MCERSQILSLLNYIYRLRYSLALALFLVISSVDYGYDNSSIKENLIRKLSGHGFENIRVKVDEQLVIIAYENRVYRFDVEAVKEVLNIVVPELSDVQKIILIPENRKIPLVTIEILLADCKNYFDSKITGKEFGEKLNIDFNVDRIYHELEEEELENSSSFRFDVALKPQLNFEFGPYEKPVISQINIVPELKTSWWKGMNFNYELIVPLVNEFGTRGDSVRPGIVTLNQVLRLPDDYFISASAGIFTQNRYGLDFEMKKYFLNGEFNLGFNLGLTSFALFTGMTRILYYDAFAWTGSFSCEYRISKYDLTLGLTAGRFLKGDESIRFDINREFGEIEIGFFAIRSRDGISNGGINITIPIFPSHYWKPNFVRLRTNENFFLSYLVKSNTDQLIGLRYNTGSRLGFFNKKLNPMFIKNYFSKNY